MPALSGVYKGLSGVRPDGTAVFDFSQHRSVSELCPMNPNWVDSGGNLGGPTSGGLAGSSSGGSAGGSAGGLVAALQEWKEGAQPRESPQLAALRECAPGLGMHLHEGKRHAEQQLELGANAACSFHESANGRRAAALDLTRRLRSSPALVLVHNPPHPDQVPLAQAYWGSRRGAGFSKQQLGPFGKLSGDFTAAATSVVSLGCGTSEALRADAQELRSLGVPLGDGATLVGIDVLSHDWSQLPPGVEARVATAAETGLTEDTVDIVYGSNQLYNHEELQGTADEIARILTPGGVALVTQTFEGYLVLEMAHMLHARGLQVVEWATTSENGAHVLARKGAQQAIPVELPVRAELKQRPKVNADLTCNYEIRVPCGDSLGKYVGSTCTSGMLEGKIDPVNFYTSKGRGSQHLAKIEAGEADSPKLQRAVHTVRAQPGMEGWLPFSKGARSTDANVTSSISKDGLTTTYEVGDHLTLRFTRLDQPDISLAINDMVLREQVGIDAARLEGTLLNASVLAGAPDLEACMRGGARGGAIGTTRPLPSPPILSLSPAPLPSHPLPLSCSCSPPLPSFPFLLLPSPPILECKVVEHAL